MPEDVAAYLFEMGAFSPEARENHKEAINRPEVKEKHQAAYARPEVKEKRMETYQEKLAAARTEVFSTQDLDAANRSASQAIGGGKSYAWMKPGESSQQR